MSQAVQPAPPSRARDGLTNATRTMTEQQLSKRHRLMVEYMVYGLGHRTLIDRMPLRYMPAGFDDNGAPIKALSRPGVHEPLSLEDAAAACNVRPRIARLLSRQPVFQRLLAEETAAMRDGAKARAVHTMITVMEDPGLGKAADRKVRLTAAAMITGEIGNGSGTTVNVNVGGTHITAGIVIDLRDDEPTDGKTIEHEIA